MKNPPGMEMFLNKHLYLNTYTYKRMGFRVTLIAVLPGSVGGGFLPWAVSKVVRRKGVIHVE